MGFDYSLLLKLDPTSDWNTFWLWATILMGCMPLIVCIVWLWNKK